MWRRATSASYFRRCRPRSRRWAGSSSPSCRGGRSLVTWSPPPGIGSRCLTSAIGESAGCSAHRSRPARASPRRTADRTRAMDSKRRPHKPTPTSFLPLATVFEALQRRRRAGGGIEPADIQKALGLRSLFLAQRLLVALGGGKRRFETAEEFITVAQKLMAAPIAHKIEFLFNLHDIDGDGWIRRDELERLVHIALAEHDLRLPEGEADRLVDAVMRAGDRDRDQKIGIAEFVQMMIAHPEIQRRLAEYGVSLLMPGKRARDRALPPGSAWSGWVRSGGLLAMWLAAFTAVNALLFVEAFFRYRDAGANLYVQLARGAGACLNLNAALIVVPMLRHTLTWVRR